MSWWRWSSWLFVGVVVVLAVLVVMIVVVLAALVVLLVVVMVCGARCVVSFQVYAS